MEIVPETVIRRWLEVLLPVVSAGLLTVHFYPEYVPSALIEDPGRSLLLWVARAVLWAVLGIWGFSALIVVFFLLYSPVYLLNRAAMLMGEGGWVDRREVRFYLACALLLALLIVLVWWIPSYALVLFVLMAGCGPIMWRVLV